MKPLKNWDNLKRGYTFREKTNYSANHLGLDLICPTGTPVLAPFKGRVTTVVGKEGGNTVWFYYQDVIMRMMHLSSFGKTGEVNEGDIIGAVGSTGSLSTGPHLHIDISKNNVNINIITNFLDPETYNWGDNNMKTELFGDTPTGRIFTRTWERGLSHIPNPDELKNYFGDNPVIQWVDNLDTVGFVIEDPRPLKEIIVNLKNNICKLENQPLKEVIKEVPVDRIVEKEVIRVVEKPVDKFVEKLVIVPTVPSELDKRKYAQEYIAQMFKDLLSKLSFKRKKW